MHSMVVRGQNVFGFFTTVAFCVAALVALSVVVFPQTPSANIKLSSVQVVKGRPHYYSSKKEEYAHIKFDLDADLSSLFNWNTKQVFVWVTASWPASRTGAPRNEAVIWDQIIPANATLNPNLSAERRRSKTRPPTDAERGVIRLRNQKAKYQITDIAGKLADKKNATLQLSWNVQPWIGALLWTHRVPWGSWSALKGGSSKAFDFPPLPVKKTASAGGDGAGSKKPA